MFKKLQENSLYWRYRFVTRRWLAMRRWWRERQSPRSAITAVRYRGVAAGSTYLRGGLDRRRGIIYILGLAAALTALQLFTNAHPAAPSGLLVLAVVALMTFAFARYW